MQLICWSFPISAYRIEISDASFSGMPVFLAGYYGDRVSVMDSSQFDNTGHAIFSKDQDLCTGLYTLVIPGKWTYDILIASEQRISVTKDETSVWVSGNDQTTGYAEYLAQPNEPVIQKLAEQYPNTFLSDYLKALQPGVPSPDTSALSDMKQMLKAYQLRKKNFFTNINLSDTRLLRTPLYLEQVQFYVSKFITQHVDTLLREAVRLMEMSSGSYETFFFMSDFLTDYSLRSPNGSKMHNYLIRNRALLTSRARSLIPQSFGLYYTLRDEKTFQDQLSSMTFSDTEEKSFDPNQIDAQYRIFYFWSSDCPRCLSDVPRWQSILTKNRSGSCFGIAVNTKTNVIKPTERILAYDPLCVNVSLSENSCQNLFFIGTYSKIVLTDASGNVIGIFGSSASLDNFFIRFRQNG